MTIIVKCLSRRLLFCGLIFTALLTLLSACRSGPVQYGRPTYIPTPTFPPFPPSPQPSPTLTPAPLTISTPPPNPLIVTRQKQVDGKNVYTINLSYPYLEQAPDVRFDLFNIEVDKMVNAIQQEFLDNLKKSPITPDPNLPPSFLGSEYKITYGDAGLLSVLFSIDYYIAGAAHPNQYARTLNLNISEGKVLSLGDLFNPGVDYLKIVSDYCIQDLKKQGRLETESGALPDAENYRSWNITPQGLLISFDPYQVIAYAAGPQSVTIPYTLLKSVLNAAGPLAALLQ